MMYQKSNLNLRKIATGLFAAAAASTGAGAVDYDFSGTFTEDNNIAQVPFTVNVTSAITIFTSSWVSGAGGGFDPIIAIWDSTGAYVAENDDGGSAGSEASNSITYNYGLFDSYFTITLTPGTYTATVAQYDNFALGSQLGDGFRYDGDPHFTFTQGYGPAPYFNGVSGDLRNSNWALHLVNVDVQVNIPDSGNSMALMGFGLVSAAWFGRRHRPTT